MVALTFEQAQRVIKACIEECEHLGTPMAIAVVDARGDMVALARMDGPRPYAADVARGKAMASALAGQPSGALADRASTPVFQAVNQFSGNRLVFAQGAVPIVADGVIVGAVGASGGSPEQDEDVAKKGAATLGGSSMPRAVEPRRPG